MKNHLKSKKIDEKPSQIKQINQTKSMSNDQKSNTIHDNPSQINENHQESLKNQTNSMNIHQISTEIDHHPCKKKQSR